MSQVIYFRKTSESETVFEVLEFLNGERRKIALTWIKPDGMQKEKVMADNAFWQTVFEKYGYSGNGIGLKNKLVDIDVGKDVEISIECDFTFVIKCKVTSIEHVVTLNACFPWRH
jgi:hypothetical protein